MANLSDSENGMNSNVTIDLMCSSSASSWQVLNATFNNQTQTLFVNATSSQGFLFLYFHFK